MPRGKVSVQHYESGGREMLKALDARTDEAHSIMTRDPHPKDNGRDPCQPEGEMAGHIVDQLRRAYDELLHEPLPDHLRQLLATLSKGEEKS